MPKKMLIDATHAEETRVVVVDGNKVEEFDFESENKRQLAGNIYLAKVTRVEPSLQAAFVDYGGNRHGFLAFSEIHPDYYQIPVADRKALMEEEAELAREAAEEEEKPKRTRSRSRKRTPSKSAEDAATDATPAQGGKAREPSGMETIDLDNEPDAGAPGEGLSPMETVHETPVAEPEDTPDTTADAQSTEATAREPSQGVAADTAEAADTSLPDSAEEPATSESAPLSPLDPSSDPAPAPSEDTAEMPDSSSETGEDTVDTDEAPPRPIAEGSRDDAAVVTRDASGEDDESHDDDEETAAEDAASRDATIESVADDDTHEDIRPVRKPRPRRYKIQEVVKVRQILLVQVVKEERGNKGAALTTYLSLAGRYCVLMPNTARGGGISRKITNAADRSKLKEIANSIDVPKGAGLIIRTAGAKRTKTEIKRDYEYLQRLWEQIRELTLKSIAPAKIYEEGDLIKRSIRDLYSREIDEVLVEGERGYRVAKDFMKMIMPSHAKNVKNYVDPMPLFARHQVESYLSGMFNPTVQLKSGGYIVIGVTEALVAIDVNSGRATKEGSIEDTATKTNLEAAEEVARQLRLRDLAGLIVIDFIDMDERKNNAAVEKRLKDKLKTDRARIQVGRISGFGLLEMSRQRLRPGMIEATTQPCPACHGTGLIRSDDNLALQVLRQIEEEGVRRRSREVLVKCPVGIANYLMNQKREHIAQIEARYGMSVRIEGEPHLVSPDFTLEKFKTATRTVPEPSARVVSVDTSLMDQVDEDAEPEEEVTPEEAPAAVAEPVEAAPEAAPETAEDDKPKKKRRRRRRRSKSKDNGEGSDNGEGENGGAQDTSEPAKDTPAPAAAQAEETTKADTVDDAGETAKKPARTRTRSRKPRAKPEPEVESAPAEPQALDSEPAQSATPSFEPPQETPASATEAEVSAPQDATPEVAVAEPLATTDTKAHEPETANADNTAEPVHAPSQGAVAEPVTKADARDAPETADTDEKAKPARTRRKAAEVIAAVVGGAAAASAEPEHPAETADEPHDGSTEQDDKPKRRGWWSLGS